METATLVLGISWLKEGYYMLYCRAGLCDAKLVANQINLYSVSRCPILHFKASPTFAPLCFVRMSEKSGFPIRLVWKKLPIPVWPARPNKSCTEGV